METRVRGFLDRLPGPVDVIRVSPRQGTDYGGADLFRDKPDRFEAARRADGEARLNNIHPEPLQLSGYLQLLLD